MGGTHSISGGMDTLHPLPDAAHVLHRGALTPVTPTQRDRWVAAWLHAHGHADIADILGLTPAPARPVRRMAGTARATVPLPWQDCPECRRRYRPRSRGQQTCGKSCGSILAARRRAEQKAQAS